MARAAAYRDASLPAADRVEDLLARMTMEEKVAQLGAVGVDRVLTNRRFSSRKAKGVLGNGIGQITRAAGRPGVTPGQAVAVIRDIQKFLRARTRLGIPAMFHEECLTGVMAGGATTFPQAIGLASTWNPDLMREVATVIRRQMRELGGEHGLAPVLDVVRDPRWGRTEETLGEDPYLVARMGTAYIEALQGEDPSTGVAATAKHFAAHGFPQGGRNCAPVHVGAREFREIFLFPFEAAVKEAKTRSVMNAYHEVDGVPCAADRKLLTGILREEWGFEGIVVADYGSIRRLEVLHRVAANAKEAAVMALEAGIDIELPRVDCYGEPLLEAIREGLISEATVNESVRRVLRSKFEIGLFERPGVGAKRPPDVLDMPRDRILARRAAQQSIVLLKNERRLPLKKSVKSIAVIGPNADSVRNIFGDYAYTAHVSEKNALRVATVLEGIRRKLSKRTAVNYVKGCELTGTEKKGFREALDAARKSDVVIAVVGDRSGLRGLDTSGEGRDRSSLDLPGVQGELVEELGKTGKPLVLVLVNARPVTMGKYAHCCRAIVEAWLPGEEGGNAVADVLFGDMNPGGKLPVSFPQDVGQIPVHYNRGPTGFAPYVGTETAPPSAVAPKAVFPFGHGLSYTKFRYSRLAISPKRCGPGNEIIVRLRVANAGKQKGDEVVQLYVRDEVASVARPVKELKGFQRVTLDRGEAKTVTFSLSAEQLAFYDADMRLVVEPGVFKVMIGASSEDIRLEGSFEVTGQAKVVTSRRRFFTAAEVGPAD